MIDTHRLGPLLVGIGREAPWWPCSLTRTFIREIDPPYRFSEHARKLHLPGLSLVWGRPEGVFNDDLEATDARWMSEGESHDAGRQVGSWGCDQPG